MASSTASSNFKYHVFLSFRGEDTRKNFVSFLYDALKRKGIYTFKDDNELEKGEKIDELFKAIENSKLFIIVFSKDYASSSWCLKELAKIMERQKTIEQTAYPLFYDVDPSEIRNLSGEVGKAFSKHKNKKEQVAEWKKALEDSGTLVGWDLRNRVQAEAINELVEEISLKLRSIHLSVDENIIGMESRMQGLQSSLGIGLNDNVRMIGIKGMGGVGKTTLAKAIFEKEFTRFEGSSFVEDVREVSKVKGLNSLQQQILADVLNEKDIHVSNVLDGEKIMRTRLPQIKVLIVLDDVDDSKHLEALAGATGWFKKGSRIIITTRNEKLLKAHGVNENLIHDVSLLSDAEAIILFSRYAFKGDKPNQGFENLSSEVLSYAKGLPLTIKTLGAHLYGEKKCVWIDTLKRLETIPVQEILKVLEISYDGLENYQKEIFLDVACFMKGLLEDDAIRILESCGSHAISGLRVLELKSLVNISNQRLAMHDSIEELGRNIVRRPYPNEPCKNSRLWICDEVEALLSNDAGSKATCIRLEQVELSPEIVMEGLGKLQKLKVLLITDERAHDCLHRDREFDQATQYFPNTLQFLSWSGYPFQSLPQSFLADNLVGLELSSSSFTKFWESGDRKALEKLRFLDLSDSKLRTLDLQMTPNLERLDLQGCHDLRKIHAPAGCLEKLVYLNLVGCSRFRSFLFIKQLEPLELLSLPNLEVIVVSSGDIPKYSRDNLPKLSFTCYYLEERASSLKNGQKSVSLSLQSRTKLESVSGSICGLQHLKNLTVTGCIPEVPNDLDQLTCLEKLHLVNAHIRSLPDSICKMRHLKSLKLKSCELLEKLPKDLGQLDCLEKLSLSSAHITHVPDSICMLKQLKSLKLKSCKLLAEVPENIGDLECLEKLNLLSVHIKHIPDSICRLKNLRSLELESCKLLEKLPEDLGKLECLEKLILTECMSLKDIPNSICMMKSLKCFHLPFCIEVKELPEDFGLLKCLKELNVKGTGISHLPQSISLLEGLRFVGSIEVLQSCDSASEIQTLETETLCYIQAMNNTPPPTGTTHDAEEISTGWSIMEQQPIDLDRGSDVEQQNTLVGGDNRTTDIWLNFEEVKVPKTRKTVKVKCKSCSLVLKVTTKDGTSSISKHLSSCSNHPKNIDDKQINIFRTSQSDATTASNWEFNQTSIRQALAKMIVIDEQPFSYVERDGFRHFCSVAVPRFSLPSRFMVAKDIGELFLSEMENLRNTFKGLKSRIALTTDCWTSVQNLNYLCLTAHFIDDNWRLHKRILNFRVMDSHKGKEIGKVLESCILKWGIEDKLLCITVDNTSANDVAVAHLKENLADKLVLGGDFFHMRCVAHILNLIVKDGLDMIKDSINSIRGVVIYVRSFSERSKLFDDCASESEISCKGPVSLDVNTWWNSTYIILDTALKFEKAFKRMIQQDPQIEKELKNGFPSQQDWDNAKALSLCFKQFFDATKRMSGTLYVTANMHYHEILGVLVSLLEWKQDKDPNIVNMVDQMRKKFDKYYGGFGKTNVMVLVAVALDPRYKMRFVEFSLKKIFPSDEEKVKGIYDEVYCVLKKLYDYYANVISKEKSDSSSSSHLNDDDGQNFVGAVKNKQMTKIYDEFYENDVEDATEKSDLEEYLDSPPEKMNNESFKILKWWSDKCTTYKVLASMAKDILAIPVSTVASESAFSTSGRVIDEFRSSLGAKTVETLICTQDWLRASNVCIDLEHLLDHVQKYEKEIGDTIDDAFDRNP